MSASKAAARGLTLVEECSGMGGVAWQGEVYDGVRYRLTRYQGMSSGMPIPGLHRIEGSVDVGAIPRAAELVGRDFVLHLEDGRALRLGLAAADGSVLSEGHGPSRCGCC